MMKKTYSLTKNFLIHHTKLGCFIVIVAFCLSSIALYSMSPLTFLIALTFIFSFFTLIRLLKFEYGRIPFTKDTMWYRYKRKYPIEEAEEKYRETCIRRASIYFICSMVSCFIWIAWEIVCILLA